MAMFNSYVSLPEGTEGNGSILGTLHFFKEYIAAFFIDDQVSAGRNLVAASAAACRAKNDWRIFVSEIFYVVKNHSCHSN